MGVLAFALKFHAARHAANGPDAITPASIGAAAAADGLTTAQKTILQNTSNINTGDQTNISGNAANASKLAVARTIQVGTAAPTAFDGTANIVLAAPPATADATKADAAKTYAYINYSTTAGAWPLRNTATTDQTRIVVWTTAPGGVGGFPPIGNGYAVNLVDQYDLLP